MIKNECIADINSLISHDNSYSLWDFSDR